MIVVPSLELLSGRVVDPDDGAVLHEDPVAAARAMCEDGALFFHLVDLDALRGSGDNLAVVERFVAEGLPCQVAGGSRDLGRAAQILALGVDRIVVGSMLHAEPRDAETVAQRYGARAVAAVDVEGGRAAYRGGPQGAAGTIAEALTDVKGKGFLRVLLTSFEGGTPRSGVDVESLAAALDVGGLEVFANVRARDRSDLKALRPAIDRGLGGVVLATACRTLASLGG